MVGSLKNTIAKGSLWVLLEQFSVQGLNFGMGIVLARLLTPNDFGTVALLSIFISVAMVLVNSGLGQALIQKQDVDESDFNTVFWVSLVMSFLLYAILFLGAPFVADYYKVPELTAILRVLAINLIMYAVNSVQSAELYKKMRFDLSFRISLVTVVTSAGVGIGMAICGFGVWALVWSSVLANVAGVIARSYFISWHPRLQFSWNRMVPLVRFGWKLMLSALMSTVVVNLYGVIIGKFHTKSDLAFVNKGRNIPDLLRSSIQTSLIESAFPAIVQLQNDPCRFLLALRRLLAVSTFVVFPLMTTLAIVAHNLILFLYGEKWLPCVPYAWLVCCSSVFLTISAVNELGMMALGRSDVFLKLNIVRNCMSILLLAVILPRSIMLWLELTVFVYAPVSVVLDVWANRRLLSFPVMCQVRDVMPAVLLTAAVAAILCLLNQLLTGRSPAVLFLILVSQGVLSLGIYLGLAIVFRVRAICEIVSLLEPKFGNRLPGFGRLARHFGLLVTTV